MMAGYSGTPLPKKLGVRPGARVAMLGVPRDAAQALAQVAQETKVSTKLAGNDPFDVIVLFCRDSAALTATFAGARHLLAETGGLWIAWPKKSSGVPTDLTEDTIRDLGLAAGLVDNKVCAIDDTWSGLRLVVRLRDRKSGRSRTTPRAPSIRDNRRPSRAD